MLTRLLLAASWLVLGVATAWAPRSLMLFMVERLGVGEEVAGALTWGLIGVELGLGLGLVLSVHVPWLRPLAPLSLVLSLVFLGLVLLVPDLRTCNCFGALDARPFLTKLVVLGGLLYLSALAAWPGPPKIPRGTTEGFRDVIRRTPGPGPDLATPSEAGTIARSPEALSMQRGTDLRHPGREHTPR